MLINATVPVYNEQKLLVASTQRIISFLESHFSDSYEVVIADNGSTDRTLDLAHELASRYSKIRVLHLHQKGRGRALKTAWTQSAADILSYMDVDLSTDLAALPELICALLPDRK